MNSRIAYPKALTEELVKRIKRESKEIINLFSPSKVFDFSNQTSVLELILKNSFFSLKNCLLFICCILKSERSDTRQDSDWKSVDIDDFEKADFELKTALEKSFFNKDDSILINRSRSYSPLSMQCMDFQTFRSVSNVFCSNVLSVLFRSIDRLQLTSHHSPTC